MENGEEGNDKFLDRCPRALKKDLVTWHKSWVIIRRFHQKDERALNISDKKHPVRYRYDDKENRYFQLAKY